MAKKVVRKAKKSVITKKIVDTTKLLTRLGKAVKRDTTIRVTLTAKMGYSSTNAIGNWFVRGRIPTKAIPVVKEILSAKKKIGVTSRTI